MAASPSISPAPDRLLSPTLKARPLYAQVQAVVVEQMAAGRWRPGAALPSEMLLADEFGVSQGTVRKALDALAREGLVTRRQGRGTFMAEHDSQRALFRFFHLAAHGAQRELPVSEVVALERTAPAPEIAASLRLAPDAVAVHIERIRRLQGEAVIVESVVVPNWLVPAGLTLDEVPNTLYRYYQQTSGITVARASERLRAIVASRADAAALGQPVGTPLLDIVRVARDLAGQPVEWRRSRCLTERFHYIAELGQAVESD